MILSDGPQGKGISCKRNQTVNELTACSKSFQANADTTEMAEKCFSYLLCLTENQEIRSTPSNVQKEKEKKLLTVLQNK